MQRVALAPRVPAPMDHDHRCHCPTMKVQPVAPTGHAQVLEINETFFSTTDARGVITAGNAVFARTAGYSVDELVGQPHNIIRHPEMPRQVFRRLWAAIRGGRPFMGYVKNHARNGNHYWVFAIVLPLGDRFLSVRIKPTTALFGQVEAVYCRLVACESAALGTGTSESLAADASAGLLEAEIRALGFPSYESFSHHALNTEIKARDEQIATRRLRLFPERFPNGSAASNHLLPVLYEQSLAAYAAVGQLFSSLDHFVDVCRGIRERKDAVQRIAEDFRLNALNASIAAHPLGSDGVTLGSIAQILSTHGQSLSRHVGVLADHVVGTTSAVADIASDLSSARIQLEMLLGYLAEIGRHAHDRAETARVRTIIGDLRTALTSTLMHGFEALDTLQRRLPEVTTAKEQLRKDVIFLQVAQISGLTEVSRVDEASALHVTFTGFRAQIEAGKRELDQLDTMVGELAKLTAATPPQVNATRRALQLIEETLHLTNYRTNRESPLQVGDAGVNAATVASERRTSERPPRGSAATLFTPPRDQGSRN
jgi:aerotaxis receptor